MTGALVFDVSVIIPTFNSEKFLSQAIDSVLGQQDVSLELIVVDANSKDTTVDIVNYYIASNENIKLVNNYNDMGPAHARSIGVRASSGKYIAFLDSDDMWAPSKLNRQLGVMNQNDWKFTYCFYGSDSRHSHCHYSALDQYNYWQALFFRGIATFTVIVDRTLLTEEVMKFYPNQYAEDYLWWLLLIRGGNVPKLVPIYGGNYRKHSNARSVNIIQNLKSINFYLSSIFKLSIFIRFIVFVIYPLDVFLRKLRYDLCILFNNLLDLR